MKSAYRKSIMFGLNLVPYAKFEELFTCDKQTLAEKGKYLKELHDYVKNIRNITYEKKHDTFLIVSFLNAQIIQNSNDLIKYFSEENINKIKNKEKVDYEELKEYAASIIEKEIEENKKLQEKEETDKKLLKINGSVSDFVSLIKADDEEISRLSNEAVTYSTNKNEYKTALKNAYDTIQSEIGQAYSKFMIEQYPDEVDRAEAYEQNYFVPDEFYFDYVQAVNHIQRLKNAFEDFPLPDCNKDKAKEIEKELLEARKDYEPFQFMGANKNFFKKNNTLSKKANENIEKKIYNVKDLKSLAVDVRYGEKKPAELEGIIFDFNNDTYKIEVANKVQNKAQIDAIIKRKSDNSVFIERNFVASNKFELKLDSKCTDVQEAKKNFIPLKSKGFEKEKQ